jgi:plasmid rolling circle replication initiator protein Rep
MNVSKKPSKVNENVIETLEKYSEKDEKWTQHKFGAEIVENHYLANQIYEKLGNRMHSCARYLVFDRVVNSGSGELGLKLTKAGFCHVRNCRICAWRRSLRNVAKLMTKLPMILEAYPKPKHEWLFLTLTVPNCEGENLRETIKTMGKAWDRLTKRDEFKAAFIGHVKVVEVTKEEKRAGYVHPHFHVLLLTSPWYFKSKDYIKQDRMLELWQESMRDPSITQVDLRKVKPKKGQDLMGAVLETLKYGFKPSDIEDNPDFLYTLTEQLHKMRFVDSGGVLKGILKDEKLTDAEMIHADDESQNADERTGEILTFGWRSDIKKYTKRV